MRKILLLGLVSLYISFNLKAQAPGCPNIVAGPTITLQCTDSCTQLSSTFLATGETTSYEVSSIPYAPPYPYGLGTPTSVNTDDVWSNVISLPFTFCFFGNTYDQLTIGSNGVISFDLTYADPILNPNPVLPGASYCEYSFTNSLPSASLPTNSIMGIYHDIDPSVCGNIRYANLGSYPCRTFVVNFDNVCQFSCNNLLSRHQIVIYESTNAIEVYVESKPTCASWNSGNALIGIQNVAGNVAYTPFNRNTGPWTVNTPEAWRFLPNGTPNYSIEWTDQSATVIGNGASVQVCPTTNEVYTAEITYTNCDGSVVVDTDNQAVNFTSNITLNTILVDTSDCGQSNGRAQASVVSGGSGAVQWLWDNGETTALATNLSSGFHCVTATDASGCSDSSCVFVPVRGPVINSITSRPDTCLAGVGSATVNVNGGQTPISFQWDDPLGQTSATAVGLLPGLYELTLSDAAGCVLVDTVEVYPLGTVPFLAVGSDNTSCNASNDGRAWVFPSGGDAPYSFQWNDVLAQTTDTASGLGAGNYSVVVYDAYGCAFADSVEVGSPALLTIAEDISHETCLGVSDGFIEISASGGTGPFTWNWDTLTQNGINVLFDSLQPGTYQVLVTDANSCQASGTYSIDPGRNVNLNLGGSNVACNGGNGGEITVSSAGVTGFEAHLLDINGLLIQSNLTGIFNNLSAGSYRIELVEFGTGCRGDSVFTLSEPLANSYSAQAGPTLCNGDQDGSLEVLVSASDTLRTFSYQLLDLTGVQPSPLFENLPSGLYEIIVTDDLGCSDTLNPIQVVEPQNIAPFIADQYLNYGDTISLVLDSVWNGRDPFEYLWTPSFGLSCDDCSNPIATPYVTSDYTVLVTDSLGCTGSTDFTLFVDDPLDIYIPNAFTPNGDGQNDVFEVYGVGVSQVNLSIYNRWGQAVFHAESSRPQWDGMYKGKMQPPGMYTYLVEVWFLGDHIVEQKGSVALIR